MAEGLSVIGVFAFKPYKFWTLFLQLRFDMCARNNKDKVNLATIYNTSTINSLKGINSTLIVQNLLTSRIDYGTISA